MISWLQISDLHFSDETDARTSNFERLFLEFCKEITDVNFVVVTGDFRHYESKGYVQAEKFLQRVMAMLDLDITKDLFIVPGNHDVNKDRYINAKEILDNCSKLNTNKVNDLLCDFSLYKQFASKLIPTVYGNSDPTQVHVRTWRNKINILHLKRPHKFFCI